MKTIHPRLSCLVAFLALALAACGARAEIGAPSGSPCEVQAVPHMPRVSLYVGRHDRVRVRALVRGGAIREVEIVKGPQFYGPTIREAMEKYQCRTQASDFWVTQEFEFDARSN